MLRACFYCVSLGAALLLTPSCRTAQPAAPDSATTQAQATTPPAALRNTRWVLRTLNGELVRVGSGPEPSLILREGEWKAVGQGGCNQFTATFELPAAGQLRFGPLLSTRMACPDPAATATETGFLRILENTRTYQISGDTLRLFLAATSEPAAVLHAVYLR